MQTFKRYLVKQFGSDWGVFRVRYDIGIVECIVSFISKTDAEIAANLLSGESGYCKK